MCFSLLLLLFMPKNLFLGKMVRGETWELKHFYPILYRFALESILLVSNFRVISFVLLCLKKRYFLTFDLWFYLLEKSIIFFFSWIQKRKAFSLAEVFSYFKISESERRFDILSVDKIKMRFKVFLIHKIDKLTVSYAEMKFKLTGLENQWFYCLFIFYLYSC